MPPYSQTMIKSKQVKVEKDESIARSGQYRRYPSMLGVFKRSLKEEKTDETGRLCCGKQNEIKQKEMWSKNNC